MEKLHKCTDCQFTVTTGRQLSDHRRKEHGVQNVICPYCPKYAEFKTPSVLKRHLRLLHPLHDKELFSETGTVYYFAVKSSAYRSISKNVPSLSSATAGKACALLHQWGTTCHCTSSSALLRQAEKDWAGLAHDSQPLFPGRDDLPEDLDEVLALMERDRHLPEVSDIPLPPLPPRQPLPRVPFEPPPPTFLLPVAISVLLSWLDEPEGKFPDASSSHLMDDYSFMALPGSGVGPKPQDKADRALGDHRVRKHQALKTASAKDPQLEAELVTSLQGSRAAGPVRRRALLHQVEAAGVPLRPLWKSVPPQPLPPPKRPKHSVEMYSPTRPEI